VPIGLHYQVWAWLQENVACPLSSSRAFHLLGPGTMYLLHPPLVCPLSQSST